MVLLLLLSSVPTLEPDAPVEVEEVVAVVLQDAGVEGGATGMNDAAQAGGDEEVVGQDSTRSGQFIYDRFERNELGPNWTAASAGGSAGISNQTYYSYNRSMYLCGGNVSVEAGPYDTTGFYYVQIQFWVRSGGAFSDATESGEDLVLEFYNATGQWYALYTFPGGWGAGQTWHMNHYAMPDMGMCHEDFRVRLRMTNGSGNGTDYWHIDDMYIYHSSPPPYSLDLIYYDAQGYGNRTEDVDHKFILNNTGYLDDTYNLTYQGEWDAVFRDFADTMDITNISVATGAEERFLLRVTIPWNASRGQKDYGIVIATSQSDPNVYDYDYPTTMNVEGMLRVGVYCRSDTSPISYWYGTCSNAFWSFQNVLSNDPESRFFPVIIYDLSTDTLSTLDALVLPDNAPPDSDMANVSDWFDPGKGIILADNAVCYGAHSGFLFPQGEDGGSGYKEYWDTVSGFSDQRILAGHNITENYTLGGVYSCYGNTVAYMEDELPGNALVLTGKDMLPSWVYVTARNVDSHGRIVGIGPYTNIPGDMKELVCDAVEWSTHVPQPYELCIYPGLSESKEHAGNTADHILTIQNVGLQGDTYDLSANGTWDVTFRDIGDTEDISPVTLPVGGKTEFIARVSIPGDAVPKAMGVNTIMASSQNDSAMNVTSELHTTNLDGYIVVGVFDHLSTLDISYYNEDGWNSNRYKEYYDILATDAQDRFYPMIIDDLTTSGLELLDALILPDNAVPDHRLLKVKVWFGEGKGIIMVDDAAAYGAYSGYLFPDAAGTNGYDTHWDSHSMYGNQRVIIDHKITEDYSKDRNYPAGSSQAQYYLDALSGGAFPLTTYHYDNSKLYVAARDIPESGKVVGLGPYSTASYEMNELVRDAVEWTQMESQIYNFMVVPISSQTYGRPGAEGYHLLEIFNTGTAEDTYDLSATPGWTVSFRDQFDSKIIGSVTVAPGERGVFYARVTVPDGAKTGGYNTSLVTVRSQTIPSLNQTVAIITTNVGDNITVALYNHWSTSDISYFKGSGVISNTYADYRNMLAADPEGRFFTAVVDDLSPQTLNPFDVLLLPDNAVPDDQLDNVSSWFQKGRGLILVDSAACYGAYSGFLFPDYEYKNGIFECWDYGSAGLQKVLVNHSITANYTVGGTYQYNANGAQFYQDELPEDALALTASESDESKLYVAARDVPNRGRLVALGPYTWAPWQMRMLVWEAVEWAARPPTLATLGVICAPAVAVQGDTNVTMARLILSGENEDFNVTGLEVLLTGTAASNDIAKVRLAMDTDGSGNLTNKDEILAEDAFFGGRVCFNDTWLIKAGQIIVLVLAYDIADDASVGKKVGLRITDDDIGVEPDVRILEFKTIQCYNTTIQERTDRLKVALTDMAPANIERGEPDVPMLMAEFRSLTGNVTITDIALPINGTGGGEQLKKALLYEDSDGNGIFQPKYDQRLGKALLEEGHAIFEGLSLKVYVFPSTNVFITFEVDPVAQVGLTLGLTAEKGNILLKTPDKVKKFTPFWTSLSTIVDTRAPAAPHDLVVINVTSDAVALKWDKNGEEDLAGYRVYCSANDTTLGWDPPASGSLPVENAGYICTGLEWGTKYHFTVTAVDDIPNESEMSNKAEATTLVSETGPITLDPPVELELDEDTPYGPIDLTDWFADPNGDPMDFFVAGASHIGCNFNPYTAEVTLTPEKDWSGWEVLTFNASDGTGDAYHHVKVTVRPINDPPGTPVIISPSGGTSVPDGTAMTLAGACDDPDIPYGDSLGLTWRSSRDGLLGSRARLDGVALTMGEHTLTLAAEDDAGEISFSAVTVTVEPLEGADTDGDGLPDSWELDHGLDPYDPEDAGSDPDGDGRTALEEYLEETGTPPDERPGGEKKEPGSAAGAWGLAAGLLAAIIIGALLFLFFTRRKRPVEVDEWDGWDDVEEWDDDGGWTDVPFPEDDTRWDYGEKWEDESAPSWEEELLEPDEKERVGPYDDEAWTSDLPDDWDRPDDDWLGDEKGGDGEGSSIEVDYLGDMDWDD